MTGSAAATAVETLRTTSAIRERAAYLLDRARAGESPWFEVDTDSLGSTAAEVAEVTRARYPDLDIPLHSRWRHFEAGGVPRRAEFDEQFDDATARARAMVDLTVVSVLLDAGAGSDWQYHESGTDACYTRFEGLAVASWQAFFTGVFSSDPAHPLRVDAAGLRRLDTETLAHAFQAGPDNPLVGLGGRTQLLHRLGDALGAQPGIFGTDGRPGGLFDALAASPTVAAHDILYQLLTALSAIWPAGNSLAGYALGDCWRHPAVPGPGVSNGWMPFHKLSQWLTYSLLEPFEWAGIPVTGLEALTGLPEYRNGGLLLDTGVLKLRDPAGVAQTWSVGDELVIEWRALTVALLDELAPMVRTHLGPEAATLPLACVLEGGTWAAGRRLAQRLRGGLPPLTISSDGTVF